MKSTLKHQSLTIFIIFLFIIQINTTRYKLKVGTEITSKMLSGSKLTQNELATLWNDLFTANRGQVCMSYNMRKAALAALLAEGLVPGQKDGKNSISTKFAWVKKWGYGESAYLFDYLDPVFQKEAITAFQKLYDDLMAMSNADTPEYQDPFDVTKLISADNQYKKNSLNLKHVSKNYDKSLYNLSVNSVQLREAMKKWDWFIDIGAQDYAINFIMKYDMNGDGRLNPRELVLGTIDHNKNALGSGNCKNCFQKFAQRLDAVFIYLDCDNDGFLSAEELWASLPKINRADSKYNIFGINNSDNIRTSAINDFVLKNGGGKEGSVTKEEFRNGILFGFWDRQTTESAIVVDDSRNLKYLRWTDGGVTDTAAFNHLKEQVLAELIAKSQR